MTIILALGATSLLGPKAISGQLHYLTLILGGREQVVSTQAQTVGAALSDANIPVSPSDKLIPEADTPLRDGMKVRLLRSETRQVVVNEYIPRQTVRKTVTGIRSGFSNIAQDGTDGMRKSTYDVTYVDGKKAFKKLVTSQIIRQAVPRVVLVGYGSALPSRGFYSSRVMTMSATAYDPGPRSCGKWAGGRTAAGMKAGKGVVAVDPRVIRLGTRLYVEGYGFAIAGDTGGAIKGRKIDLGHDSYRAAMRFGRRKVVVHVLQ